MITEISRQFAKDKEYIALTESLREKNTPRTVTGMCDSSRPFFAAALLKERGGKGLLVVPEEKDAYAMQKILSVWFPRTLVYPSRDFVFENVSAYSREWEHERLNVLKSVCDGNYDVIVTVPDLSGMETKEAEELLKELGLSAMLRGAGETVTAQLPGTDTALEAGSQVLLYLGDDAPERAKVPDFTDMTPAQAAQAAANAGLTLRFSGNPDLNRPIRVQFQDVPPDTEVEPGRTVTITFTDPEAPD